MWRAGVEPTLLRGPIAVRTVATKYFRDLLFLFRRPRTHQALQLPSQALAVALRQFHESDRLEASFGSPHGEEHYPSRPDTRFADVKQGRYLDSLIERLVQRKQAAIDRKLIHAGAYLPPIFK